MQRITLSAAPFSSAPVGDGMFQANALFTSNFVDPGGPFDRMLQDVGWSGLRFPGGTVTERTFSPGSEISDRFFDVNVPSGVSENGDPRIVTAPALFKYAADNDISVTFTLPTENYVTDTIGANGFRDPSPFGLYRLLDRVDNIIRGEYGDVDIATFQIGNEFWYRGRLSADEYGLLVNKLSVGMQALFDVYEEERGGPSEWSQPDINLQATTRRIPNGNERIIEKMSLASRESIDSVSTHYYPPTYALATQREGTFDRLDDWLSYEGISPDITFSITEWNIQNTGGDLGLAQASGMLEAMRVMLERGVENAAVWGTQYPSLDTRLAGLRTNEDEPGGLEYWLTPAGETFRMMSQSIRGMQLLDLDTPASLRNAVGIPDADRDPGDAEQLVMHAYMGDDKAVVFISSRSLVDIDVLIDPSELIPDYHHVWGQQLGVMDRPGTPRRDEGDPLARYALPHKTILNQSDMAGSEGLELSLGPYEIVKLEFTFGDVGVNIAGHDQLVDPAANYDDVIFGSVFDDVLVGNLGSNELFGFEGDDTLIGGVGDDLLDGGSGDDLLISGGGNNTLIGGEGSDTLVSGDGINLLRGGSPEGISGPNHFVVDVAGLSTIADFDFGRGDGLSFRGFYASADEVLDRASVEGNDIVIDHDDGGETWLLGQAGRIAVLEDVLIDFADNSPVEDIVRDLNTPPPSGEIPPDPGGVVPETVFSREAMIQLLSIENAAEIRPLLIRLSAAEEESLLDQLNPNAFALSASQGVWREFCRSLSVEGFERLIGEVDLEILDLRFQRFTADEYANGPDNLNNISGLPVCRTFPFTSEDVRVDYFLVLSEMERSLFEEEWAAAFPEETPKSIEDFLMIDDAAVEARLSELLENGEDPGFVRHLLPGQFSRSEFLDRESGSDDEEDEEDEDDENSGRDGSCFIATCAYGDADHPDVTFLRLYRDLELSELSRGRIFIRVYYIVGPWIADLIRPCPVLRRAARSVLARAVAAMRKRRERP